MSWQPCGPPRCWPSRAGWGLALGLAVYIVFMHSQFYTERTDQWGRWWTAYRQQVDTAIARRVAKMNQQATEAHEAVLAAEDALLKLYDQSVLTGKAHN